MITTLAYPEAPPERGRGARVDGEQEVSGQLLYAADLTLPGLLSVAVVRSPYPHARIVSVNTGEARQVPGVQLVLTSADVASLRFGRAVRDVPIDGDARRDAHWHYLGSSFGRSHAGNHAGGFGNRVDVYLVAGKVVTWVDVVPSTHDDGGEGARR